jgi:hypothetical protein
MVAIAPSARAVVESSVKILSGLVCGSQRCRR